jgi:hypothetical protein
MTWKELVLVCFNAMSWHFSKELRKLTENVSQHRKSLSRDSKTGSSEYGAEALNSLGPECDNQLKEEYEESYN